MSSSVARVRSAFATSPVRSRSRMCRRPSPIASARPLRYGASPTPRISGPASSSPATSEYVRFASAYSFSASSRYPANRTSGCWVTPSIPSSSAVRDSRISPRATSNSPRWTARIAFAEARIERRAAGRAFSRAAVLASKRSWSASARSSRFTLDADRGFADDDVDGLVLEVERVLGGRRRDRERRRRDGLHTRDGSRLTRRGRRPALHRQERPDVDHEHGAEPGGHDPYLAQRRNETDQE